MLRRLLDVGDADLDRAALEAGDGAARVQPFECKDAIGIVPRDGAIHRRQDVLLEVGRIAVAADPRHDLAQ